MALSEVSNNLLAILRGECPDVSDWNSLLTLANKQGVAAIVLDKIDGLVKESGLEVPKSVLMKWIGTPVAYERRYAQYEKTIGRLAKFYNEHGFRMMVLKGYGLSIDYPIPNHRPCGDIDIWNFGDYKAADAALSAEIGIRIDNSRHHHTVFHVGGFMVENHYDFINVHSHKSNVEIEKKLHEIVEPCRQIEVGGQTVYLPSSKFNALFLTYHASHHFAAEEMNLRQLLDWAYFIKVHGPEIDWDDLYADCIKWNKVKYLDAVNAICVDYLGFSASDFPVRTPDKQLEDRVLGDIMSPEFDEKAPKGFIKGVLFKYRRWKANAWKNEIVYPEKPFPTLIHQFWSHLLKPSTFREK